MKILITGGAGFIGSHLAEALLERGDDVVVLDDLSTGVIENVQHLLGRPRFTLRIGNCLDASVVGGLVDQTDVTVHLAAAVGVRLIVERPVHTIETNIGATEIVLSAAARKRKKVLLASTSEVYGKSAKVPFAEDDDVSLGPTNRSRWAYACSKALDEWLAFAYGSEKGLPVVIARFFNTVGPRQTGRYGMVVPTFVRQALAGDPLTVHGDGRQSRCFAHVRDVVRSVIALLDAPAAVGEVFNVGNPEEVTMMALAERVKAAAGSDSPIRLVPYDEAYAVGFQDMARRVPDVSKLRALIGYAPDTPLTKIIDDVIAYERGRAGV
ncbi:MAG: NAD-dependent epimerase/dehydratase family protein [Gemmatimonadetes bacterium]|nr:NAD-dependent epimerase/dehydratase family protein [Gemmatimonadota bacterium]